MSSTGAGLSGLIFHANAYQIHGEGLTSHYLGNLITVSNIEAPPSTKLFDLWVQQSLFDDTVSLRLGQIAADDEFFVSQYAPLFISSTFGWRLTRRRSFDGTSLLDWRCAKCWRQHKDGSKEPGKDGVASKFGAEPATGAKSTNGKAPR